MGGDWKGGRVNAVPDCPQYTGRLPDRHGDWGLNGLNMQTSTHQEKAGTGAKCWKEPLEYRPPVGQWSPQTGMGSQEHRFNDRTYIKGQEANPPNFRVKGSSPSRSGASYKVALNKFPTYREDPWDDKVKAARENTAQQRKLMYDTKPFKPTRGDQDYRYTKGPAPAFAPKYTSSIVFRPSNVGRR